MTESQLLALTQASALTQHDPGGACELCSGPTLGDVTIRCGSLCVHAACAAPALASARKHAGKEPLRGVTGVVCGICKQAFRYRDEAVIVGTADRGTAIHVRRCKRRGDPMPKPRAWGGTVSP